MKREGIHRNEPLYESRCDYLIDIPDKQNIRPGTSKELPSSKIVTLNVVDIEPLPPNYDDGTFIY